MKTVTSVDMTVSVSNWVRLYRQSVNFKSICIYICHIAWEGFICSLSKLSIAYQYATCRNLLVCPFSIVMTMHFF